MCVRRSYSRGNSPGTHKCVQNTRQHLLVLAVLFLSAAFLEAGSLPLAFEPNQGQAEAGARYVAPIAGHGRVLVRGDGFEFVFHEAPPAAIRFLGASRRPEISASEPLPGKANYFSGRRLERSLTGVPQYGRVRIREVYPGIDAALHGVNGLLEYDFLVSPHAAVEQIRLALPADAVLENGELVLRAGAAEIRERRPVAYQDIGGERRSVPCSYRLRGSREAGFALGAYDAAFPLVIDPVMWVSYLGSYGGYGNALAVDTQGNTYSAGWISQSGATADVTVVKLNAQGTAALFTSTITAPGSSYPTGMVLDSAGFVYVTGATTSTAFPTTPLAYQNSGGGFLLKLGPDGKLQYATQFHATPAALAVDRNGSVYLTGSAAADFQTTPGVYQPAIAPGQCPASPVNQSSPCPDAFVLKLNPQATAAVYATFLGGSFADQGSAIAVDAYGAARVAGATGSSDFPLAGAGTRGIFHGLVTVGPLWFGDAFATELSADGRSLVFSTYLGGSAPDQAFGVGVTSSGETYVAGQTSSTDFPVTAGAYRTSYAGQPASVPQLGLDGFVTKLNADGSIGFSTYFPGTGAMWLDQSGNAYLATLQFPTGSLPVCNQRGVWAEVLRADGAVLIQPGGYPSPGFNGSSTLGVDIAGNAYVMGTTESVAFLATPGAYQTESSGDREVYVGKVSFTAAPPRSVDCVLNAASLAAGNPRNYSPDGAVSPGEIITLYGHDIGPAAPTGGQVLRGHFPTQIGDTQLFFDGIAAPLLYAGPYQINAVVPFQVQKSTALILRRSGVDTGPITLPVSAAVPGVFLQGNPALEMAAATNQDGTLNSAANPAARGSIITFYATGAGTLAPPPGNGEVLPLTLPLPVPSMGASVLIGGKQAPVQYAGSAPGAVAGLLQVNVTVPEDAPTGAAVPLQLYIGDFVSQLALQGQPPLSISVK